MATAAPPVLVVEDDGLIRMDLVSLLFDAGFLHVLEAANADQALGVLAAQPDITAILTDIDMPGSMNGLALARLAVARLPHCRIMVISGRHTPEPGSMPEGARFLTKPISEKLLYRTLEDLGVRPTL